jgi:hypothetical protein
LEKSFFGNWETLITYLLCGRFDKGFKKDREGVEGEEGVEGVVRASCSLVVYQAGIIMMTGLSRGGR